LMTYTEKMIRRCVQLVTRNHVACDMALNSYDRFGLIR